MKRLFVLGILLFAGTLCLATPAFVQGKFGGNPTSALAFTSNNTAGNTIIVMLECSNGGSVCMTNLTDSQGNTYRKFAVVNSSSSWFLYIYVATNIASGANTVTCNSFGGFQRMAIAEYSGTGTTYPIRSVSFGFAGSGATLSGNISGAMTTVSGDLVVAWGFSLGGSMSAGTGCTARATNDGFGMFEDCTVSGSSLSPTMTNGSNAWSFVAVDLCPSDCFPASVNTVRWNAASSTSTTSQTITLPANTANNLMVLGIRLSAVLSISVSDSAGNTWKKAYCNNATSQETCLFYAEGIASSGSTNTVTITWGGSTRNVQAFLKEYSNVGSSGVLRYAGCGYSCTGDSNSTPKKGSVPSASSDLIVKLTNTSGNMVYAPPSGYNFITGNDAQFNAMMYDGSGSASVTSPADASQSGSTYIETLASFKTSSSGSSDYVQGCLQGSGTTSVACTLQNTMSTSNKLVVMTSGVSTGDCSAGQVTDTASSTWTLDIHADCTTCTQNRVACIWRAAVPSAATDTITYNPGAGYAYLSVMERSNLDTSSVLTSSTNNTAPPNIPAITIPGNNTTAVCVGDGDAITTQSPADLTIAVPTHAWGIKTALSAGSQGFTFDNGSVGVCAAYGPTGAASRRISSQVY